MYEFCSVLHPQADTYESIRRSSPLLYNTVIYLGARALGDPLVLSITREEALDSWKSAVTEEQPCLETVQALSLRACWHDDSYITSGVALRMALHLRWHLLTTRFARDCWASEDPGMRPRICELRTWLIVQFLDFK